MFSNSATGKWKRFKPPTALRGRFYLVFQRRALWPIPGMDKAAAPRTSLGTAPAGFRPCPPLPLQNIPAAARGQLRAVAHRHRLPPVFEIFSFEKTSRAGGQRKALSTGTGGPQNGLQRVLSHRPTPPYMQHSKTPPRPVLPLSAGFGGMGACPHVKLSHSHVPSATGRSVCRSLRTPQVLDAGRSSRKSRAAPSRLDKPLLGLSCLLACAIGRALALRPHGAQRRGAGGSIRPPLGGYSWGKGEPPRSGGGTPQGCPVPWHASSDWVIHRALLVKER